VKDVGVIVVTYDNPQYVIPCVQSILDSDDVHIYIVNNGRPEYVSMFLGNPSVTILQQSSNLGWEGGLKKALEVSTEEFVVLMNDDTHVPQSSQNWIDLMLNFFSDPRVGAVGPSSNCVMGHQNIFANSPASYFKVNYLIGFCMMVRRKALDEAGGIDDTLPGGDDLDLSIRLRKAGYDLVCEKNGFIYHHGFKTGERVEGPPNVNGGWNSIQKIEWTNWALMKKHTLREWLHTMNQVVA
jgi:O-antigen biosynthesis protein